MRPGSTWGVGLIIGSLIGGFANVIIVRGLPWWLYVIITAVYVALLWAGTAVIDRAERRARDRKRDQFNIALTTPTNPAEIAEQIRQHLRRRP